MKRNGKVPKRRFIVGMLANTPTMTNDALKAALIRVYGPAKNDTLIKLISYVRIHCLGKPRCHHCGAPLRDGSVQP